MVLTYILLGCPCCLKNGDLLSVLASRPHVNGVFGHQQCRFLKTVPKMEFFQKTPAHRFRVEGRKRRFSNAMVSYIKQHMPCKGCYRISTVLAFSCEEGRTIRICHMSRKTQKISIFKNTCGRGLNMNSFAKDLQLFCATFLHVLFLLPLLTFF